MPETTNVDHISVFEDDAGEWRWHAIAGNDEIVSEGESHPHRSDAFRAARGVFGDQIKFDPPEETDGQEDA